MRALVQVLRGERKLDAAATEALQALLTYSGGKLRAHLDLSVLDSRDPAWRAAVDGTLLPAIEDVFTTSFEAASRGIIDPAPYAARHLESVWNRLVGEADTVFDMIRTELETGRAAGESVAVLSQRVEAYLADGRNWKGRAATIARTETIGANNAGARDSARATADLLGVGHHEVVRTWLATMDGRTRPSHQAIDGESVVGLDAVYELDGCELIGPGDPGGCAEEVVNCRCTELFSYPGDPDYPIVLASAGRYAEEAPVTTTPPEAPVPEPHSTVIIAALPAADDPVQGIGPEDKHATLLFFGSIQEGDDTFNPALVDSRPIIEAAVAAVAAAAAPGEESVTGIESLGNDGARVWMLDGTVLADLRAQLLDSEPALQPLLDAVEQHPDFTAHVTIGHVAEVDNPAPGAEVPMMLDPATEDAAATVQTITFDRLAVWWAGEHTEYTLAGGEVAAPPADAPAAPADPAQTAVRAVALRIRGLTFAAVAEELGYSSPQAARTAIESAIVTLGGRVGTYAEEEPGTTPAAAPPMVDLGPDPADMAADGDPWYGILCPEGMVSGDARRFAEESITWRDTPLPLMYQDATALGHDGAVRVGRIDNIWRDSTRYSTPMIRGNGVWDTSPIAVEAQRQVETRMLRGVSVDADSVTVELRGSDGQTLDPMVDEFPADGVVIEDATAARISGATLCSIPAFHQAYVANGVYDETAEEPGQGEVQPEAVPADAVAASAWSLTAAAAQIVQPAAAFTNPGLDSEEWTARYPLGVPLTVDGDRVYGHLATWGICHIGIDGICQEPPESFSDYGYYSSGSIPLDDGTRARVGPITMGTGHAPLHLGWRAAMEHYDNTGTVVADVAIGQDTRGIWFAGMIRPGTSPERVYALAAAGKVSGDWREVVRGSDELELVAALVVNVPGFPIPRPAVAASGGHATAMVASGIVRTAEPAAQRGEELLLPFSDIQRIVGASVSRHLRVLAVRDKMEQLAATRRGRKVAALSARMDRS